MRRDWIVSVLDDLIVAAEANCRPEVSLHLRQSRKMITPYIAKKSRENQQNAEQQVLADLKLNLRDYEQELKAKTWAYGSHNQSQLSSGESEQHTKGATVVYLNRPHWQLIDQ